MQLLCQVEICLNSFDACLQADWCALQKLQTSAGMRLFTGLDQEGLFSPFCSAEDGRERQVLINTTHTNQGFIFSCLASDVYLAGLFCFWICSWTWGNLTGTAAVQLHRTPLPPHFSLIGCNLKSRYPDGTFSDASACMFCMAVWIKDCLSLLLSCSNPCPLWSQEGSGEFPKQSGLTVPGRYGRLHFNKKNAKPSGVLNQWEQDNQCPVIISIEIP